jgi:hypothetical protein
MFNPLHRKVPRCPECERLARIAQGRCVWCDAQVYTPVNYFRWLWGLVWTTVGVLGALTFNATHAGTWLLVLLFSAIPIRIAWGILIPPWIEAGTSKNGLPFITWYWTVCVIQIITWTLFGGLQITLGASRSELNDNWDVVSVPLGWINSAFIVRPDKSLFDNFGIIAGNSFFPALATFLVYTAVRARLNRSRAIRINITDAEPKDEQ